MHVILVQLCDLCNERQCVYVAELREGWEGGGKRGGVKMGKGLGMEGRVKTWI